jgi:hypothetical protein
MGPIRRLKAANRRHGAAGQIVPPDGLDASLPKEPEAKVQIYTAEIVPKGWTNFHCHNGATFFIALQGIFEAIRGRQPCSRQSRRRLFRADQQDSSRPQPARHNSLFVRGVFVSARRTATT